ncbi:Pyruvate decarboxylase [Quillaja saponaria]|uniref:pyruvate decarboxylase n=1 Tax=Quillaja saponaria TaxID=32244 RepID=A0AAD7LKI4_QUISA|nr:Pyruvate decarboxylase [Quillaja saponaria]
MNSMLAMRLMGMPGPVGLGLVLLLLLWVDLVFSMLLLGLLVRIFQSFLLWGTNNKNNDYGTNRILHHTIGLPDFSQEIRCFQPVTCFQALINNLEDAHELIDTAISNALKESKPVYISISCNLQGIPHPTFSREPIPFSLSPRLSNKMGLDAAVEATVAFLNKAVKPVMVGG